MDIVAAFRMFVRLAENGSFTAVARELGIGQPAVSRQLTALEEHLGARLIQRTTRSATLTEDGLEFLGHARTVLENVDHAMSSVGRNHDGLSGLVRISATVPFGRTALAPRLGRLMSQHPRLEIELRLTDGPVDLVHDGIDLAVRVGEITESSMIARRLGAVSRVVVAAPAYLQANGTPIQPADLAQHECVLLARSVYPDLWRLQRGDERHEIHVSGRFRTDSVEAARVGVKAGLGLGLLSNWLMQEDLANGSAQIVLPGWEPPPDPISAVYPSQRNLAPRTRAVINFLAEEFRTNPTLASLEPGKR